MSCQICFEEDAPIAGNDDIGGALCRRSCSARVCVSCLARHVEVSLAGFYAGVLPLIRCPICLVPMRVDRWTQPLTDRSTAKKINALRGQYEKLCQQACALTPPCCHKMNYTHLPHRDRTFERSEGGLLLLPTKVVEYRKLIARFCGHRVDARDVLTYAVDNFGDDNARKLVERTLRRIADSERRARLLLAFVHMFPKIETRCCNFAICFNCKRIGHHEKCEEFDKAVDEAQCLVRCRNCRVMLMKVQGCDSVDCVCGFRMSWQYEVELRSMSKKKMLPVDLFDKEALDGWRNVRGHVASVLRALADKHEQIRRQRLDAWIHKYKSLVYLTVARWAWRYRFKMPLREMTERHERVRRERLDAWIQTCKALMFRSVERWAWRIRFSAALVPIEREFFWRAYYRAHPEESAYVKEEADAFFAIDV